MRIRSVTLAALLAVTLPLAGCSSETESSPQEDPSVTPTTSQSESSPPSPAPTSSSPSPQTYESLGVNRTYDLADAAARRFGKALDESASDLPTAAEAQVLFDGVAHHPVTYLAGITFNRPRTGYSFCIRTLNQKASANVSGGSGPVAVLTQRDCGGTTDDPIVEPSR